MKWITLLSAFACMLLVTDASTNAAEVGEVMVEQVNVEDLGHSPIPVAIWAPATGNGLSLVIISHGTGGGMASHLDTAQALAEAGFVVVAPTHPGDNFQDDAIVGRTDWFVDRSRHVTKVIDYMFGEWDGRGRLGPASVGIFGFSAGGTTALISIGGVPDLSLAMPHCERQAEFICSILRPSGEEPSPVWSHDPRLVAAVVAAPGLGFAFDAPGLADVHAPVQLWGGSEDETVPYATNAGIIRGLLPQAPDFHSVEGASHLSFLAPCTPQTPPTLCQDPPGFDRARFHQNFNQALIEFFSAHLWRPVTW
jgi:predicted dienelactone hydrolase